MTAFRKLKSFPAGSAAELQRSAQSLGVVKWILLVPGSGESHESLCSVPVGDRLSLSPRLPPRCRRGTSWGGCQEGAGEASGNLESRLLGGERQAHPGGRTERRHRDVR